MERDSWEAFEGIDVEGRLKGIKTLFIASGQIPDTAHEYPHIWFQPQWLRRHGYGFIPALLDHSLVTLEVSSDMITNIPKELLDACHIVVALPIDIAIVSLKLTDTIRLDMAPMRVACATFGSFIHSYPPEYVDDKPLEK